MRLVIQRVSRARVTVDEAVTGEIGPGFMVLVGVGRGDTSSDAEWLARKTAGLRVFPDDAGKMNLALDGVKGAVLAISQFTLYAATRKGNRPDFLDAADPADGQRLYEEYIAALRAAGVRVETGVFGAEMRVELVNEGPVTLCLDSAERPGAR